MNPIVGIGELLWDIYPDGTKVAGGAPFNFAFHCQQLGHPAAIVSRVGDDDLGRELRDRVRELGLSDEYIQTDPDHPTGTVRVALDANKVPTYTITENVAWDYIAWSEQLGQLAGRTRGVAFGTLAQRSEVSGATVVEFVTRAGAECGGAYRIFDMNLRQHYCSRGLLAWSIARAPTLKLSEEELRTIAGLLQLRGTTVPELVASLFQFNTAETRFIYLTRGAEGAEAYFYRDSKPIREPAIKAHVVDTVGAGDAFTAAMMCLTVERRSLQDCVRFANHYAARVCEHQGATPRIDRAEVERAAFGA